uniref:Uncharacterized protein n=1 Tax=Arundo donax TaxID=35708 RepID=A0A0A9C0S1_ARUDO
MENELKSSAILILFLFS